VASATDGLISHLQAPSPGPDSAVLLNCLVLKALWQTPFELKDTRQLPFHAPDQTMQVATMCTSSSLLYGAGPGCHIAELPYAGGALVFDCILPDRDLDSLKTLTATSLNKAIDGLTEQPLDLTLPRLTLQSRLDLMPALVRPGIHSLLDPRKSDLQAMFERPAYVSAASQELYVQVDEQGTRAAAVTDMTASPMATVEPPLPFHVDRPFLFLIRDRPTNLLLFIGKVSHPKS
jgi:serpin B